MFFADFNGRIFNMGLGIMQKLFSAVTFIIRLESLQVNVMTFEQQFCTTENNVSKSRLKLLTAIRALINHVY